MTNIGGTMKNKWTIIIFACFSMIVVAFQNCGEMSSSGSDSLGSLASPPVGLDGTVETPEGEIPPPPPNDPLYKAGEPFDPSRITRNVQNEAFTAQLLQYLAAEGRFRAVAINEDGDGLALISNSNFVRDQAEWDRVVLDRCQLNYKKYCALIGSGSLFAIDEENEAANRVDQFANFPTTFEPGIVPGEVDYWRNRTEYNDNLSTRPLSFHSYWFGINGANGVGWSAVSQELADRWGKEHCETIGSLNEACMQLARGVNIVWDPNNFEVPEISVQFGRRPFLGPDDLILAPNVVNAAALLNPHIMAHQRTPDNYHFMVLYARFGGSFRVIDSRTPFTQEQKEAALTSCNQDQRERLFQPGSDAFIPKCFIYAENMTVVLEQDVYEAASHHWHPSNRLTE
jgi:hypothetical protein